jgi:predicted GIY-YIG superfamily endonuclease
MKTTLITIIIILLCISIYGKVSIPKIPAVYFYKSKTGDPLYVGITNNLYRRYKEHQYAGHEYANYQMTYYDMTKYDRQYMLQLEKELINKMNPIYNKQHNLIRLNPNKMTLKDLFKLDSPLLDISTRNMIGVAITLYYEYKTLRAQYIRQQQFLNRIDKEYTFLIKRIEKTMNKIKSLHDKLYKDKTVIINTINKRIDVINNGYIGNIWNHIKNYYSRPYEYDLSIYNEGIVTIRNDIIEERRQAYKLRSIIKDKIDDETGKTLIHGLGALLMNIIIPGFGLIEAIALGGAGISVMNLMNFIKICQEYITNLDHIIETLNDMI